MQAVVDGGRLEMFAGVLGGLFDLLGGGWVGVFCLVACC